MLFRPLTTDKSQYDIITLVKKVAAAYNWTEDKVQKVLSVVGNAVSSAGVAIDYSMGQLRK
jgi:hypothetical protein